MDDKHTIIPFKKWWVKRLEKLANEGNAEAQYCLGELYNRGGEVEEDINEAFKWYEKAAEQGHGEAQHSLAVIYYWGIGVEEDRDKATKLWEKAKVQDIEETVSMMETLKHNQDLFEKHKEKNKEQ